jgi:hypothetical protein
MTGAGKELQRRERLEVELYQAIKAWLECEPEKRPSPCTKTTRLCKFGF